MTTRTNKPQITRAKPEHYQGPTLKTGKKSPLSSRFQGLPLETGERQGAAGEKLDILDKITLKFIGAFYTLIVPFSWITRKISNIKFTQILRAQFSRFTSVILIPVIIRVLDAVEFILDKSAELMVSAMNISKLTKRLAQRYSQRDVKKFNMNVARVALMFFVLTLVLPFFNPLPLHAATGDVYPNGDITTGWENSTGASYYTEIDEVTYSSSDYVSQDGGGSNGDVIEFDMGQIAGSSLAVTQIDLYFRLYRVGACAPTVSDCDTADIDMSIDGSYQGANTYTIPSGALSDSTYQWTGSWTGDDDLKIKFTHNVIGGGGPSGRDDTIRLDRAYVTVTYTVPTDVQQTHFRWRDDTTALDTDGGWLATEDNNTIGDISKGVTYRLRMEAANNSATYAANSWNYRLEYATKVSTCSAATGWARIDTASDAFEMVDSTNITSNQQTIANSRLTAAETTYVSGDAMDTTDESGAISLAVDEYTELEYSIRATSSATDGGTYCFRMTDGGSVMDSYPVYPEATLSTPPPQPLLIQEGYVFENGEGTEYYPAGSSTATKIDDASNFASNSYSTRQVVRTSRGTLYAAAYNNVTETCEIWKSTNGASWAQQGADIACAQDGTPKASVVLAIDSNDVLHIAYYKNVHSNLNYVKTIEYSTFDTTTDTFISSNETIASWTTTESKDTYTLYAMSIDSNDAPHVLFAKDPFSGTRYIYYRNRTGGSWQFARIVEATIIGGADITINEDDIPEIVYRNATNVELTTGVGDANNATTFTLYDIDTTPSAVTNANIAIDAAGNTWVSYIDENGTDDYVTLAKHADSSAWTTGWTFTSNSNPGSDTSITPINDKIYVFYEDSGTDDIAYDVYDDGASSWAGETILETGTYSSVKTRWASTPSNFPNIIDYLFRDATDLYWNRLTVDGTSVPSTIDEGTTVTAGTKFTTGKTLSNVRQGESIILRTQLTNTGNSVVDTDELALFYDRNDGDWTKVGYQEPLNLGPGTSEDCAGFDDTGGSTDWYCETVFDGDGGASDGDLPSLAFDSFGTPWVAFINTESLTAEVVLAQYVGSGGNCDGYDDTGGSDQWSCTTVFDGDDASDGRGLELNFDSSNTPWLSFYNEEATQGDLVVAKYRGTAGGNCDGFDDTGGSDLWDCTTVVDGDSSMDAYYTSSAMDASGDLWVAYSNTEIRPELVVAKYRGTAGGNCDGFDDTGGSDLWDCTTVVDGDSGGDAKYNSIAIDQDGNPWIAFSNHELTGTDGVDLAIAKYRGTAGGNCDGFDDTGGSDLWDCTTVVDGDDTINDARGISLTIDPSGNPWIASSNYESTATAGTNLLVAKYRGTAGGNCDGFDDTGGSDLWDCTTVVDGDASNDNVQNSTALDYAGNLWVISRDSESSEGNTVVAKYRGTAGGNCDSFDDTGGSDLWDCTTIFDGSSGNDSNDNSIAFDPTGNPWIAFGDTSSVAITGRNLVVAKMSLSGEILIAPSLSGTAGDSLLASHVDMTSSTDTTNRDDADCIASGASWNNGTFMEAENGSGLTLGAGDGTPRCTELAWTIDTSQATAGETYRFVVATKDAFRPDKGPWRGPISVGTDGYPTMTMASADDSTYRYSKDVLSVSSTNCTDTDWTCETIDAESSEVAGAGLWSSIGTSPSGEQWISYRDVNNLDLMVARYVGSGGTGCSTGTTAWDCTTVDSTNSVGAYTSLAFAQDGTPWVSYGYSTDRDIRVAHYVGGGNGTGCADTDWTCETVATTNFIVEGSLAIDHGGAPWITYRDATNTEIWIAHRVGGGNGTGCADTDWSCEKVEDADGGSAMISITEAGIPMIALEDLANANLEVIRYVGSGGSGCGTGVSTAWNCTDVYTTSVQTGMGITNNSSGNTVVTFNTSAGEAWAAEYVGGTSGTGCAVTDWTCTKVVTDSVDDETTHISATDAEGNVWFTYSQTTNDDLYVAHQVGSGGNCDTVGSASGSDAWQCDKIQDISVDDGTYTSQFSGMAFDSSGALWISYYNRGDGTCDSANECGLNIAKQKLPSSAPTREVANAYNGRNAGSTQLGYMLSSGLAPYTDSYGDCGGVANMLGYCGLYTTDGYMDSITAQANERPIYQFSTRYDSNDEIPTANVTFQTDTSPATNNVVLQVYRYGTTNAWETVSTYSSAGCSTEDCSIKTHPSGTSTEYYETDGTDYWVHYRLYQVESSSASITLSLDQFTGYKPKSMLRGGRVFRENTTDPLAGW